jgi:drug/metabolite transporter (DMT)-like permease
MIQCKAVSAGTITIEKKALLPYLALGSGILALSFSGLFVRWADAPGPVMGFYRLGLATLILLPGFAYKSRSLKGLGWGVLLIPVLGGVFSAFDHAIWNTAIGQTSLANATLLNNTAPLWVALVAWLFFRERQTGVFWLGLVLTLTGAIAVMGSDFLNHPNLGWGDLLALSSGLFYAGYFLVTQSGRRHLDTLSYVWIVVFSSSIVLFILSVALRLPLTGYSSRTYLAFLGAALISQVGGYLSVGYALGHLPASVVSPTMIGQPVCTALLAIPLLGEALNPIQWIGGLSVLLGIYLIHRSRQAENNL